MLPAKGEKAVETALKADLVILNTAVAGKWLDAVLKEKVSLVLPKVLWWIHEMRGHYFKVEYVKHLPFVAGAMIDSHTTAEYWKNRTRERLGYASVSFYYCYCPFCITTINNNLSRVSGCMRGLTFFFAGLRCLKLMSCILETARSLSKLQKIV